MSERSSKNHPAVKYLLLLLLSHTAPVSFALESDKDQPIEVEANTAELDDVKKVSVYTGNVILTRGTIRMTGDKMTVYQTENDDLDTLIMEGHPATYRQLPDDSKVYDKAKASIIEYYELKHLTILKGNAVVIQEGARLTGDRIDYDTELSKVKARTISSKTTAGSSSGSGAKKEGRVKLILKGKKNTDPEKGPQDHTAPSK